MFEFIYKRQIKELKKIQTRQHELYEEKKKYEIFPHPSMKSYHPLLENFAKSDLEYLAKQFTYLFTGIASFKDFQQNIIDYCHIENKEEYFEALGKFFLQLSGNMEELERIKSESNDLRIKEAEIKDKLGIK